MTAVEWLFEQYVNKSIITIEDLEKAKEMEEKQIEDAHIAGFYSPPFGKSRNGEAKQYYEKTFKNTNK